MNLENIFKRNPNMKEITGADAENAYNGYPVVANTAGLKVGETVIGLGDFKAVKVEIGGVAQRNASIVIGALVMTEAGKVEERGLFLSTLLRKIDLSADYKGLIAESDSFEKHAAFTNKQWVEAFKSVVPFKVADMNEIMRDATMNDGSTRQIRVRELEFAALSTEDAKKAKKAAKDFED